MHKLELVQILDHVLKYTEISKYPSFTTTVFKIILTTKSCISNTNGDRQSYQ